jgi:hypothetical protein
MTSNRLTEIRDQPGSRQAALADPDERSMRWLELGLALGAIAAVVLMALGQS